MSERELPSLEVALKQCEALARCLGPDIKIHLFMDANGVVWSVNREPTVGPDGILGLRRTPIEQAIRDLRAKLMDLANRQLNELQKSAALMNTKVEDVRGAMDMANQKGIQDDVGPGN
jgi:hypothetical protein